MENTEELEINEPMPYEKQVVPSIFNEIEFEIKIKKLSTKPYSFLMDTDGHPTNTVYTADWELIARHEIGSVLAEGTAELMPPDTANFTEFSDLTEETVISWIEQSIQIISFKNSLAHKLTEMTAVDDEPELPWS